MATKMGTRGQDLGGRVLTYLVSSLRSTRRARRFLAASAMPSSTSSPCSVLGCISLFLAEDMTKQPHEPLCRRTTGKKRESQEISLHSSGTTDLHLGIHPFRVDQTAACPQNSLPCYPDGRDLRANSGGDLLQLGTNCRGRQANTPRGSSAGLRERCRGGNTVGVERLAALGITGARPTSTASQTLRCIV